MKRTYFFGKDLTLKKFITENYQVVTDFLDTLLMISSGQISQMEIIDILEA